MKNNKELLRNIGLIIVSGIVITSWWLGWFHFIFYLLGLYTAVYIISHIFKTTAVISFLISVGGTFMYIVTLVAGLYLLYLVLNMMFNGNFIFGLIIFILVSILGGFLQLIPMSIALILGYPLIFMLEDLENRFSNNINEDIKQKEVIENETIDNDTSEFVKKDIYQNNDISLKKAEAESKTFEEFWEDDSKI